METREEKIAAAVEIIKMELFGMMDIYKCRQIKACVTLNEEGGHTCNIIEFTDKNGELITGQECEAAEHV